jgi:hydrogenase maturation protein HypF
MQVGSASRVAARVHVRGVVQGVGFRPFVYRLARGRTLDGWVLNGDDGVRIHVEGPPDAIAAFVDELRTSAPPAAQVTSIDVVACDLERRMPGFEILHSASEHRPTTRISPDLPVCADCLRELFDPVNGRYRYPYINCTNCGPRFSIVRALPYDRARTTMADWSLCPRCAAEYENPEDRRFHAQPVACAACGPGYRIAIDGLEPIADHDGIEHAAGLLRDGRIVAIKGLGGYHLACDADNARAVAALRERKYRKDQAFAVMVRDLVVADATVCLAAGARSLLTSLARPIVLAPSRKALRGVAPDNRDLGVMLPYTPLHHLLFAAGAPPRLVMTSGNRSSEPIAYRDEDARTRLSGLADALLVGERPIARRVDDSVVRWGALGPVVLRRSRGLAPGIVATLPGSSPILALGGDLKNAITIVVDGQACVSQHIGDLSHLDSRCAFAETVRDLLDMYAVAPDELTVAHDSHPDYASTAYAASLRCASRVPVQHHRAHVASVLAERNLFDRRVVGVAFDGTGYGDDGTIWGGEFFAGSLCEGLTRVAHLRPAVLPGGDAAARHPVQAAAGFLSQVDDLPDLLSPPFRFPTRYADAAALVHSGLRSFPTTSAGRLFDTVAALLGFTRTITFEGQAAMWLEHLARGTGAETVALPCRFTGMEIDWRDTLAAIVHARIDGIAPDAIAFAFHRALARAIAAAAAACAERANVDAVAVSGGVMQNQLLLDEVRDALPTRLDLLTNREVPPNDGGVSLGQAALSLFAKLVR